MKFGVHPSKISSNIEVYVTKVKLEIEWKCMICEWINKFEFKRSERHTQITKKMLTLLDPLN